MIRALGRILLQVGMPVVSILALWYLAILTTGLPAFVIPRPERVLQALVADRALITHHLIETLKAAAVGYVLANVVGIGLAALLVAVPVVRQVVMPAAITLRNVPYVALVTVLSLALGDTLGSKVAIVVLAGFFPVLVNTYRGLLAADPVALDRMRVLSASPLEIFLHVRLPYALPYIVSAQEITGKRQHHRGHRRRVDDLGVRARLRDQPRHAAVPGRPGLRGGAPGGAPVLPRLLPGPRRGAAPRLAGRRAGPRVNGRRLLPAVTGPRPSRWGLFAVAAVGIVAVTAIVAATGVLPGETALRALVRGLSSYEMRRLARTIRPLGTWWGLVPWLLLLLAVSPHARRRWWLWGAALIAAPLCGEALQELVGRLRPHGTALGFPSGHATAIAAFAVATVYLVGRSRLPSVVRGADQPRGGAADAGHRVLPHGPRRALDAGRRRRVRAGRRRRRRRRVVGRLPPPPRGRAAIGPRRAP